jgi:hypothetical protein
MPDRQPLTREMNQRFGDRFSGLYLTYVDLIYWPVWRHELQYHVYETVPLDALEEGFLLLVEAGVSTTEQAAALLGCSKRYALEMARRLDAGLSGNGYLRLEDDGRLQATKLTATAIKSLQRQVPVQQSMSLLRDSLFGEWLSFGATPFETSSLPDVMKGAYRWLSPEVSADIDDVSVSTRALEETQVREILDSNFATAGVLEWATVWVAVYQPEFGAGGRYLLFNPVREDEPLTSLSRSFEDLLRDRAPQMYFKDDQSSTSTDVWDRFASRIRAIEKQREIASGEVFLEQANEKVEALSQELPAMGLNDPPDTLDAAKSSLAEIEDLKFRLYALSVKLDEQKQQLAAMPRVDHIEAGAHPAFVKATISAASTDLIMICPWIKWRVLGPLLPEIDAALKRGCRVWVGYGMPKSVSYPEKSDQNAVEALKKRESSGLLRLAFLGTHEKVLIQDDEVFMNSSFNFLSYTGGDGRRESGTIQRGGISELRLKFIDAIASAPVSNGTAKDSRRHGG